MLAALSVLAVVALADPPEGAEPPSPAELAAIAERGRELAGYDAAAWHASDALRASRPAPGSVARYIARKADKGWVVAFGRYDEDEKAFLIAHRATQGDRPDEFRVETPTPPEKDAGFFLAADRAIGTALKDFAEHFEGERRPYNVAVLPADEGKLWVYLVPAPTRAGVWPLGGDTRYLVSPDGSEIVAKRQLHRSIIEVEPPEDDGDDRPVGGVHTHVLDETPEDTDVFHVLSRKPAMPETIVTKRFVFQVAADGVITYVGKSDDVLKRD